MPDRLASESTGDSGRTAHTCVRRPDPIIHVIDDAGIPSDEFIELIGEVAGDPAPLWVSVSHRRVGGNELPELVERLAPIVHGTGGRMLLCENAATAVDLDLDGIHLSRPARRIDPIRSLLGPERIIAIEVIGRAGAAGSAGVDSAQGADVVICGDGAGPGLFPGVFRFVDAGTDAAVERSVRSGARGIVVRPRGPDESRACLVSRIRRVAGLWRRVS